MWQKTKKTKPTPPLPDYQVEQREIGEEKIKTDLEKVNNLIKPGMSGHHWRQKGAYLVCTSCPVAHSVYIGIDKRLTGFDQDGNPILENLSGI